MTLTRNNALVAAIIATVNSVFPFLVLVGVLDWSADTIAAAMLVVTNTVTMGGLMFSGTPASNTPPPGP